MRASTAPQIKRNGLTSLQNRLIKEESLSLRNIKIKTDTKQVHFLLNRETLKVFFL